MRCSLAASSSRGSRAPHRYFQTATVSAGHAAAMDSRDAPGNLRQHAGRAGGAEQRFGIYADGEYYGPFAHVAISPCMPPGRSYQPVAIPMSTFFRVDDGGME